MPQAQGFPRFRDETEPEQGVNTCIKLVNQDVIKEESLRYLHEEDEIRGICQLKN